MHSIIEEKQGTMSHALGHTENWHSNFAYVEIVNALPFMIEALGHTAPGGS